MAGCRMRDAGCGMRDAGHFFLNEKQRIVDPLKAVKGLVQFTHVLHDHVKFDLGYKTLIFPDDFKLLVDRFKQYMQFPDDNIFIHR